MFNRFMKDWVGGNNGLLENPPNAAIIYSELKPSHQDFAQAISIELTNPIETQNGWLFHIKPLNNAIDVGDYKGISIFIDNIISWDPRGKFYSGELRESCFNRS